MGWQGCPITVPNPNDSLLRGPMTIKRCFGDKDLPKKEQVQQTTDTESGIDVVRGGGHNDTASSSDDDTLMTSEVPSAELLENIVDVDVDDLDLAVSVSDITLKDQVHAKDITDSTFSNIIISGDPSGRDEEEETNINMSQYEGLQVTGLPPAPVKSNDGSCLLKFQCATPSVSMDDLTKIDPSDLASAFQKIRHAEEEVERLGEAEDSMEDDVM